MGRSLNQVLIHAIWNTKNRESLIKPYFEKNLHKLIRDSFLLTGSQLLIVNGVENHVHCLFRLSPLRSVAQVMKQVKGASSYWINLTEQLDIRFEWQEGYAAFSVDPNNKDKLWNYIRKQKSHHQNKSVISKFEINDTIKISSQ